ncbi:MAG: ATPase, T2SS/T4P/T4SS family [Gammaproteobacteria bacterium]
MAAAPSPIPPPESGDTGSEIARLLVKEGVLDEGRLSYAMRIRAKLSHRRPLLDVLRELGYVTEEDLRKTLKNNHVSLKIGALLVELGYLREPELKAALAIQKEGGGSKKLGDILVENHFIQDEKLVEILANQLGFLHLEPEFAQIERSLLQKVNAQWCKRHRLIPIGMEGERAIVAFADPMDQKSRREAEQIFGSQLIAAIATKRAIMESINAFERSLTRSGLTIVPNDSEVVGLVDTIIIEALRSGTSDIHIEPMKERVRVRFRRDGVLVAHRDLDKDLAAVVTSRIKVLARADIAEKRRHQGGRIVFEDPKTGHSVDLRVSFYATIYGEKTVIRLLSRKARLLAVEDIGLAPKIRERFYQDVLDTPSGIVLITGPTGSGKTTTLYSCVNYLNDIERCIITAEDPVEYVIDGIAQCSLDPKIDLTFENTLAHMVRQDPDVIVLGEIRDQFSAEAAIQAALTGHKVLTTFHTEDTIGGLLRLMNMDIETFLISSTVVSVLAQRLLREVCPHCAEPYQPNPTELQRLGCTPVSLAGATFKVGRGCGQCRFTGYSGRIGVFELLILNEMVKDAILNKRSSYEIRRVSIETSGMVTLLEDGLAKAAQGKTTIAEVLRHLPRVDKPRPLADIKRLLGI